MDFVFYDLETTGLSPAFDQPLQFAAIYTDENFVEKCLTSAHMAPNSVV
jgi:exodeoxyribonuclease-1